MKKKHNRKTKNLFIIISIILAIIIAVIIGVILFNKKDNKEIVKPKWDGKAFLPIDIKYDFDKKTSTFVVNKNKVSLSKEYETYDSFVNVSKNNIAFNAIEKNSNIDLYIINLDGEVLKNIDEISKEHTDKIYSGLFYFENDFIHAYYVNEYVCNKNTRDLDKDYTVDLIMINTYDDEIKFEKISTIDVEEFLIKYPNYCK